jgi:hypothetical protein
MALEKDVGYPARLQEAIGDQRGMDQGLGRSDCGMEDSGTGSLKVFRKATSAD